MPIPKVWMTPVLMVVTILTFLPTLHKTRMLLMVATVAAFLIS